jgi:hypothetical protein
MVRINSIRVFILFILSIHVQSLYREKSNGTDD